MKHNFVIMFSDDDTSNVDTRRVRVCRTNAEATADEAAGDEAVAVVTGTNHAAAAASITDDDIFILSGEFVGVYS